MHVRQVLLTGHWITQELPLNVEEEEQFKQLVSFVQLKQYFKQGRQVLLTVGQ